MITWNNIYIYLAGSSERPVISLPQDTDNFNSSSKFIFTYSYYSKLNVVSSLEYFSF